MGPWRARSRVDDDRCAYVAFRRRYGLAVEVVEEIGARALALGCFRLLL